MQRAWAIVGKLLVAIGVIFLLLVGIAVIMTIRRGVSAHIGLSLPRLTTEEIDQMKRMDPISPHEMQGQKEDEEFFKGDHKNESH